jgi:hypothetical protein
VKIVGVHPGGSADEALVEVEVGGKKDPTQKNGKTKTAAYDLRLFRDGQIVGQWPEPQGRMGGAEDIGQWRADSIVPMAEGQAKTTHLFKASMDKTNCQRSFSGYVSPAESRLQKKKPKLPPDLARHQHSIIAMD